MVRKSLAPHAIAFGWGLAEAVVFFIVPDVYIGYCGLKGVRRAMVASLWALAGALVGGLVMYVWASRSGAALHLVRHVPAITPTMVQAANAQYVHHGIAALFIGMTQGIPYKVYSVLAPAHHVTVVSFLLVSAIARFSRFALVGLITAWLSKLLGRWLSLKVRLIIFTAFWLVFYTFYFVVNR